MSSGQEFDPNTQHMSLEDYQRSPDNPGHAFRRLTGRSPHGLSSSSKPYALVDAVPPSALPLQSTPTVISPPQVPVHTPAGSHVQVLYMRPQEANSRSGYFMCRWNSCNEEVSDTTVKAHMTGHGIRLGSDPPPGVTYTCHWSGCGKKGLRQLGRHVMSTHLRQDDLECPHCGKFLVGARNLADHLKSSKACRGSTNYLNGGN
ncbi:hypothetical protein CVT26_011895 [Gymnopilus dilepis]|uniref:C2H2-type domain-containing protein n=1 Tax=Gymnopilus dilepis TaxID=231916 RepID=A0A409X0H8_9AGAR|nr:hypothetical protein CVT26_011895 [Gymnopilus dilepis]